MPFVNVQTNACGDQKQVLSNITQAVHEIKGDPVAMISSSVESNVPLSFGGDSDSPAAIIRVHSTGFTEELTAALTSSFTKILGEGFGVPPERMYVFFREITPDDRYLVGWNGKTFKELRPEL